jgi:single-strand DNA-binding protein
MNETLVTVVGNVATQPEVRKSATGALSARFRLATTVRRWDRERAAWADGHTSFYTVWAWRQLGENVAGSVSVGEPLVVQGRLRVREERGSDGQRWISAEIDAVAVGHDLSRGTSAFRRMNGPRPELTVALSGAVPGATEDPVPARSPVPRPGSGAGSGPGSAGEAEQPVTVGVAVPF